MVFGDRSQSLTSLCIPGVLTRFPMCEEQQRGARRIQCPWYSLVTFFGVSPTPRQGQSCRAPLFPCWSVCEEHWREEGCGKERMTEPLGATTSFTVCMCTTTLCGWQDIPFSGTVDNTLLGLASCFSGVGMPFPKLMHSKGKPVELAEPHFTSSGFGFFSP